MSTTEEAVDLEPFRRAVHGLYLASLPDDLLEDLAGRDLLRDAIVDVEEAARVVAASPVDRMMKMHAVASTLNRKPALAERRQDLAAVIAVDDPDRDPAFMADRLQRFADEATAQPGRRLSPDRWDRFLTLIAEPRTSRALVNKPGCNDDEIVPTPEGNAASIKSRFWTNLSVEDLTNFIEPSHWAICGTPFWRRMEVKGGTQAPFRRGSLSGYTAVFEEVVNLPVVGDVTVYLRVEYGLEAATGQPPTHVYANYELATPATTYPIGKVTFDSGWLCATTNTVGPAGEATLVEGLKAIRFADPDLNQFPDLACDGGWVYLMMNMALRCAGVPTPAPVPVSEVPSPEGVSGAASAAGAFDGIEEAIDDWVRFAGGSVQRHGERTKSAVGRILGPRYDPRWINDLLDMGPEAVGTTKVTLNTWRRILDELAKLGGEP
jgi:hypothetical protein